MKLYLQNRWWGTFGPWAIDGHPLKCKVKHVTLGIIQAQAAFWPWCWRAVRALPSYWRASQVISLCFCKAEVTHPPIGGLLGGPLSEKHRSDAVSSHPGVEAVATVLLWFWIKNAHPLLPSPLVHSTKK